MSKYTRKQRVKTEDEFVSLGQGLLDKARTYGTPIAIAAATAVAIVGAVWAGSGYLSGKAEQATETFGRAARIYEAELITDATTPPKNEEENPIPHFKTDKERADATLAELDTLDKKFGSSEAARSAALLRAGVLFDQARYDEAEAAYKKFLEKASDPPLRAAAQEGIGMTLESRGKLDEALAAFKTLETSGQGTSKSGEYYHDRARIDQARVLARKGDRAKATEILKDLLGKLGPTSPLKDDVQSRIAMLETP